MNTRVIVVCGSGGVGKTTTAAALAIRAAQGGARVAVLTIDPARRLADALGIGELGNTARRVPLPDLPPGASLDAMMLDAKATFDAVVTRHAPSAEIRERILANRTYRFASTRLPGAHEYMAMEKLHELAASGQWDVVVLDTPPAAHALEFLAAPARMANLMDEGVMQWLVLPTTRGGWRMLERGSEMLAGVLKSMLGERTIVDIAEFFASFQGLWDGFRERSLAVRALLAAPGTTFVLVTTPAAGARAEALAFLEVLRERALPFGGFLVNRCTSAPLSGLPPQFGARPGEVPEAEWESLVAALGALPVARHRRAEAEARAIAALTAQAPATAAVWRLPDLAESPDDLAALSAFAQALPALTG